MTRPMLKLRADAYWTATDNELNVLSHKGFSSLPLSGAGRWMDRLVPHLDGRHTADDFTASLSGNQQTFVRKLLRTLVDRGVVSELDPGQGASSPEVALLSYLTDTPDSVYETWCATPTSVIGDGLLADAVATACVRSGLRHVGHTRAGTQIIHVTQIDDPGLEHLEDWCDGKGVRLLQVVFDGPAAWITPPGVSFTAARSRLRAADGVVTAAEPAATVLANQVVQALLTSFARTSAAQELTRFDLDTLATTTHRFVPTPDRVPARTGSSVEFAVRFTTLLAEPLPDKDFSRAAAAFADDRLGVFEKITEADYAQLPLRVARTTVTVPATGEQVVVHAVARDSAEARIKAATEAIRRYSALTVDSRQLVNGTEAHCYDLVEHKSTLLPATLVHDDAAVGVAAAQTVDQAIVAGLIDHCRNLTIAGLDAAERPFSPVDLGAVTSPCLRMLAAAGVAVAVYDVTGSLGVPTFAVVLDGTTAAYGCGTDTTDALEDGLLNATAAWQSSTTGQLGYAPPRVVDLPRRLRGDIPGPIRQHPALTRQDLVDAFARAGRSVVCALLDHDRHVSSVLPAVHVITKEVNV